MVCLNKLIPILVILLTLPSISQWVDLPIGNTTVWMVVDFITLYAFYKFREKCSIEKKFPKAIKFFLIWVMISAIRGCFMADFYWDYKLLLINITIYFMGISFFYFSVPENVSQMSRVWCFFAIVAFWFFLPFMQMEAPGKFLSPFAFLVIFWPLYSGKWRIIVIFFSLAIVIFGSLGARSSIIRISSALCVSILFLKSDYVSLRLIKWVTYFLVISPCVLFVLGASGIFNVLNMNDYLGDDEILVKNAYSVAENDALKENLKADTRTFLYEETILSAIKYNYVIQGRSLARGYESPFFSWMVEGFFKGTQYHKGERQYCEVFILNVFTYMGLIGVFLYGMIFFSAIRNVFQNANSRYMYFLALYVAFRWVFAWIEEFTRFDLNNLYLWVALSMCFSPYFLKMTDSDFKNWAYNIFPSVERKRRCE